MDDSPEPGHIQGSAAAFPEGHSRKPRTRRVCIHVDVDASVPEKSNMQAESLPPPSIASRTRHIDEMTGPGPRLRILEFQGRC
jgi:hypothetical protein